MKAFSFPASSVAAALAMAWIGITPAAAETFPTKPVKIIMPVPAGSSLDVATRLLAEQLGGRLGQQVIVENRPGAGGGIAAQAVATAQPDGYTLIGGASSVFRILPVQKNRPSFDINQAFVQVGMILGSDSLLIAVSPKLGVKTFPEFVALAKSKPGQIAVGTNSAGSLPHFAALAIAKLGDIPINVVPYNQGGTQAAIADILGGRVQATIESYSGIRGQLDSGDLKLIAVMAAEADPEFPGVSVVAATVPGLSAVGFLCVAAPTGTPDSVVRRLNDGLRQALDTPIIKQRFHELGLRGKAMTPAETTAFIASDQKLWWPLVKELEGK